MRTPPQPPAAGQPKDDRHVKFRILALLSLILLAGCRNRGRCRRRRNMASMPSAAPARWSAFPPEPGTSPCSIPPEARDSRGDRRHRGDHRRSRRPAPDVGDEVVSTATFTVTALRRDPGPARQVVLPYFDVALRGGATVAAKQIGQAVINFPAGDIHGWTRVQATRPGQPRRRHPAAERRARSDPPAQDRRCRRRDRSA